MLILNDLHLGVQRSGGTTPASREALRDYMFDTVAGILATTDEGHLCILGDLFDSFTVDTRDLLRTYLLLAGWLSKGGLLTLVAGNHDNSPRAEKVSSFSALAQLLHRTYPLGVKVLDVGQAGWVDDDSYAIAHCANQELFDIEMNKALTACPKFLLVHGNFDNNFAVESDHSLNVSQERAAEHINNGTTIIFAHEHQARVEMNGGVVVLGNQFPSSVSDCLNNDAKFAHIVLGEIEKIQTWHKDLMNGYTEIDWSDLANTTVTGDGFVRVVGHATAAQASEVINAIAAFRQRSSAFVVANAVRVEGIAEVSDLPASFEAAKAFDVLAFIQDHLESDEMAAVQQLLKD